jgi:hypothetical protein
MKFTEDVAVCYYANTFPTADVEMEKNDHIFPLPNKQL